MPKHSGFGAAALAVFLPLVLGACAPQGRTLATVGERQVTVADLEDAARAQPYLALDPSPEARRRLLDELVDRSLLVGEALRRGYDKDPALAGVRRAAEEDVLPAMLYRRVVGGRVRVSEAEARAIWERMDQETRVAQIFTFTEREARAAADRLARGEEFEAVALVLSRDRASAATGGDLGFLTAGQLPADIENVVRGLEVGRWGGPIRTPVGYYLVKAVERRPFERAPYEEMRAGIEAALRQRKERTLVLDYLARLKQRYAMKLEPAGRDLLTRKWQNRSPQELIASEGDLHKLGFTDAELAVPVVSYKGGAYTVGDFFREIAERAGLDRPPPADDPMVQLYLEDRAVFRIILEEARAMGLDRDPEAERQIGVHEDSYLISMLYERVIVPQAEVTAEERQRLAAEVRARKPAASEMQAVLADREARLFEEKRGKAFQEMIARLRKEHPPKVNEKALADVPWPPPKENA